MKKFFQKILSLLHFNRKRDLPAFLVSLLLAFSIWLFYNLSLKYQEYVVVPTAARCNIEGHSVESANTADIGARCRTSGYNVMHFKKFSKKHHVTVNFSKMHSKGGEIYYVTASDLQEYAHLIFGENTTVEYFLTDTAFFRFPYETHKRVAVRAVYDLDFKPQYMIVGSMNVAPDSITVYGEPYMLDRIDNVYSELIKQSKIDSDVHGVTKLEKIRGVRYSEESIRYGASVSRYVEVNETVPLKVKNVPSDKRLMPYPSTANVTFKCRFPYKFNHPVDSAEFYVDYNEFIVSRSGKCLVRPGKLPYDVIDYTIIPEVVECVASDHQ